MSGRWTGNCASTWWTSSVRTSCRLIPGLATAIRSARRSFRRLTTLTQHTRSASDGRPAICCWWTTSAPRTPENPSRDPARWWSRWPTPCISPIARRRSRWLPHDDDCFHTNGVRKIPEYIRGARRERIAARDRARSWPGTDRRDGYFARGGDSWNPDREYGPLQPA